AVVEELVGLPFQGHAAVWAAILVQVRQAIASNGDHLQFANRETAALSFEQFGCRAQSNHHVLRQRRRLSQQSVVCGPITPIGVAAAAARSYPSSLIP